MAIAGAGRYKVLRPSRASGNARGIRFNASDCTHLQHDWHSVTKATPCSGSRRRGRLLSRAPRGLCRIVGVFLFAASLLVGTHANADTEPLKIGVLATLDGAFEPLGRDAVRGYEIAVQEHEEGDGERPIETLIESTDGTPDSVVAKARLLIDRGASIVIGPLAGIEGIAIRDFAKSVPEVTFINGASAAQDATLRAPAENFFRFNPDSMQWIGGLGRYAYDEKDIRTIVTVGEDYSLPYTQLMGFALDYCAAGGRVLGNHWVSPGASDTAGLAERVARTESDALLLALDPRTAKSFLEAYGEAGGQAAIVASSTTLSGSLLRAGDAIRSLLEGAISALPVSESDDNDDWEAFTERYRASFPDADSAPSIFALSYYVNAKALFLALEETDGELGESHETLREALAELELDTPFGGPVALDENRQAVTTTFIVEVAEVDGGILTLRTVDDVEEVGQTLGLPRDAFLALGPPGRDTARCLERVVPELEPEPTPPETEEQPLPETADEPLPPAPEVEVESEAEADLPAEHPLLQAMKDATMTETGPSIVPCLSYRDAPAAIEWLKEAFGFTENFVVPGPDDTIAHAQLAFDGGMVMVGSIRDDELQMRTPCDLGGVTQSIYIVVEDADAHYERAVEAGAEIVRELEDTPYGSRDYSARDPEGHLWNFGTYRPAIGQ